ncbi:MBL fold metallo-hydrolase [Curtobacterium sp. MCJR17_055]|uniref:MBL fold metallo-hydrolase n=1 Tax=unclassified Curtobacterium TaxID=257496 RepID=UPI000DA0E7CA|nr:MULTISPECIES: MBL fold metallo-hydrolase [unclassified Curtobacterium]PYY35331.1 MBL fold metallo-hydrolase [Curtobacterium sp. MCBD17_029]PYY55385.1 MBL fold metallo-hydrolase [Curtobacterium sp. MCJR17_055]PYY55809.1 MBL fold metallo-hydrolase [Curtobacterium sp. MCPF17_015]
MLVTKLEHACLVVEEDGARLVIDPGAFTRPVEVTGVVAVVVTHEHPDHGTAEQVAGILERNPGIPVFGPAGVATALAEVVAVDVVTAGEARTVGPFSLTFHGTRHQLIHSSVPVVDNTGVFVNGLLFHPGDAYIDPGVPVELFATPVGAPWLKIGELMDHLAAVAPRRAVPIHEATLSDIGLAGHTDRIRQVVEPAGEVVSLAPGESLRV